jgi:hypothetical protein
MLTCTSVVCAKCAGECKALRPCCADVPIFQQQELDCIRSCLTRLKAHIDSAAEKVILSAKRLFSHDKVMRRCICHIWESLVCACA